MKNIAYLEMRGDSSEKNELLPPNDKFSTKIFQLLRKDYVNYSISIELGDKRFTTLFFSKPKEFIHRTKDGFILVLCDSSCDEDE